MRQSNYYIEISENGNTFLASKNENTIIKNLGKSINSSYGEYAPVLKRPDNILLFTSRRETAESKKVDKDLLPYENIFVAKKIDGEWQLISDKGEIDKYVPKDLNSKKHDAGIVYSSDGNTLYTYKNDAIWKSILEKGKWSNLVELDKNINTSQYNIPSVSLSKDGNTIYFVSYRKNGIGGKDIYKSIKNSEGNWGEAEMLGEVINTKFDEDSPFISEDGNSLYFSSKGHKGIGGYDVFKSSLVNGEWTTPKNMGIPINSPLDDIYLVVDSEEKAGFFASSRDGGLGGMDIYGLCIDCSTKIINVINGLLVDNNDSPLNNGTVVVKNISSDHTIGTYQVDGGKFSLTTQSIGKHELIVEASNFEKQIIYIELPNASSESDVKIKLNQFQKEGENYQIINLTSNRLGINESDTIKLEKIIASNTDTSNNNNNSNNSSASNIIIASYEMNFNYNQEEINYSDPQFSNMIDKAVNKGGKIYINIESSSSKVPTKSFKSNINLATLRGEKAKQAIIKLLKEKGIDNDNIIVNAINAIVSGPKYTGDFNNKEKYQKYQYVKITIK